MQRRIAAIVLGVVMVLTLAAGCTKNNSKTTATAAPTTSTTQTKEPATTAPTATKAPAATIAPAKEAIPTVIPSVAASPALKSGSK